MPIDKEDPGDRFGVPVKLIIDVMKSHDGVIRDGCYVPTREEVATWPAERLWWHLLGWWHESPAELIPTDKQVAASVAVLRRRPDADNPKIREIIVQAPTPSTGETDGENDDLADGNEDY